MGGARGRGEVSVGPVRGGSLCLGVSSTVCQCVRVGGLRPKSGLPSRHSVSTVLRADHGSIQRTLEVLRSHNLVCMGAKDNMFVGGPCKRGGSFAFRLAGYSLRRVRRLRDTLSRGTIRGTVRHKAFRRGSRLMTATTRVMGLTKSGLCDRMLSQDFRSDLCGVKQGGTVRRVVGGVHSCQFVLRRSSRSKGSSV